MSKLFVLLFVIKLYARNYIFKSWNPFCPFGYDKFSISCQWFLFKIERGIRSNS